MEGEWACCGSCEDEGLEEEVQRGISEEATSGAYVWGLFLLSGSCLPLAFLREELWIRGLWVEWLRHYLPVFAGEGTLGRCLVGGLGAFWGLVSLGGRNAGTLAPFHSCPYLPPPPPPPPINPPACFQGSWLPTGLSLQ